MAVKAWDSSLTLPGLIVESRAVVDGTVEVSGRLASAGAICPDCANPSTSFHSRYDRTLSDLPVSGSTVRLRLSVPLHAHVLPTTHVQRTIGAAGWPSIWPQGRPLRRLGTGSSGGARRSVRGADDGATSDAVVARHDAACPTAW